MVQPFTLRLRQWIDKLGQPLSHKHWTSSGHTNYRLPLSILLLVSVLSFIIGGCAGRQPIRVGFAGELTGKYSDMGVLGRNGTQLAVDTLNAQGGVAGRPLELIVRDDNGTPDGACEADLELYQMGVVAIIGHMTSAQSIAALDCVEDVGVVLISPTTSTPLLSQKKDYFFRVVPTNIQEAIALAAHVYERRGLHSIAGIYDLENAAFTETLWATFVEAYQALGGKIDTTVTFSSSLDPDFIPLVADLYAAQPEGVFIIASALDTALIAQQIRLLDWDVPIFISGWAHTEALIQNGGRAVEGIELTIPYDPQSQASQYRTFVTNYQERYGQAPDFAATYAYDAVLVLAQALEKTDGKAAGLPQALTEVKDFEGVIGPVSINQYGDVVRHRYLTAVQDGQFVTLAEFDPETEFEFIPSTP